MVEQWLAAVGEVRRRCCVTIRDEASSVVGQGPTVVAVGADVGCLDIFFSLIILFLPFSPWELARYGLKYCFQEPLNLETTNKQTNQCLAQLEAWQLSE